VHVLRLRDYRLSNNSRLVQVLRTASSNQAKLDARSEFKISQRSLKGGGEAGRKHHYIYYYLRV
jgi:hypothetical protein